jgi:alpha-galactosidase
MPYIGDRHTSEFLPGTITSRRNLKAYRLVRTSIETRRRGFRQRAAHLRAMTRQLRAAPAGAPAAGDISGYLERSRETAADIIAAYATGQPFIDVGNLPNIGQIDNLPRGSVVETAVRVDRNGFTPLTFGPLPEPLRSLVAPWPAVFDLTVEACFQRSRNLALQALRLDPTCAHLNTREVHEMGQRLMRAHARYLPAFK